jgi:hypothetical protein
VTSPVPWAELERREPALAALGRQRLGDPGVVLVGTIRADGTPRISPVEPLFWDGELWLSMALGTRKAMDLRRDPRVLVHNIVTDPQASVGEFKVRGVAVEVSDRGVEAGYADVVSRELGWTPEPGKFHLFRVGVQDVTVIRWDSATNDQFVARWPAGVEFVRRGTSATSMGDPEPHAELLAERAT